MSQHPRSITLRGATRIGSLVLFCALAASLQAVAEQSTETFRDWTRICETSEDGRRECILSQSILSRDGEVEVLKASVGYFSEDGAPAMVIAAPLGIALRPGVGLRVDQNDPVRIPFERCDPNGCLAGLPLSADMIDTLKRGARCSVEIHVTPSQPRVLELSLSGFTAGFDSLPRP